MKGMSGKVCNSLLKIIIIKRKSYFTLIAAYFETCRGESDACQGLRRINTQLFLHFCSNSHLRRNTLQVYSECVNGFFFPFTRFCMNCNNWMTCSLKSSFSTGGLFQLSLTQRLFGSLSDRYSGSWTLMGSWAARQTQVKNRYSSFIFPLLLSDTSLITSQEVVFVICIFALRKFLILFKKQDIHIRKEWKCCLHSFTFSTWRVPACHIYFISPDS